jgi:hypothetical protein
VETYFTSSLSPEVSMQTVDGGHGRIETRSVRVTDEIDWLKNDHSWTGLKSTVAVTAKRELGGDRFRRNALFYQQFKCRCPNVFTSLRDVISFYMGKNFEIYV